MSVTSFDFDFHKPDTLNEAIECYHRLTAENKAALYYAGGTEVISMARAESRRFDAVVDLKSIPECGELAVRENDLVIGAAVTLTAIAESNYFPLLRETVTRIADHTIQGKITLGGNLAGTIIYREAALPLLITNCRVKIMTKNAMRETAFTQVFDGKLKLDAGDFLVQVLIDKNDLNLPYNHVKRTKMDKIDYPLISLAANIKDGNIRAAVSGAGNMPVPLLADTLNDAAKTQDTRISETISQLNGLVIEDIHGSKEYRMFVLKNILSQMFENLKGA